MTYVAASVGPTQIKRSLIVHKTDIVNRQDNKTTGFDIHMITETSYKKIIWTHEVSTQRMPKKQNTF